MPLDCNRKATGIDGINGELLKYGSIFLNIVFVLFDVLMKKWYQKKIKNKSKSLFSCENYRD